MPTTQDPAHVTVRLPTHVADELRHKAREEDRSTSQQAARYVREGLTRDREPRERG